MHLLPFLFLSFALYAANHLLNASVNSTGSINIRMDEILIEYMQALDIDSSATTSEIKSAYRRLAKEKHPDEASLELLDEPLIQIRREQRCHLRHREHAVLNHPRQSGALGLLVNRVDRVVVTGRARIPD